MLTHGRVDARDPEATEVPLLLLPVAVRLLLLGLKPLRLRFGVLGRGGIRGSLCPWGCCGRRRSPIGDLRYSIRDPYYRILP